MIEIPGHNTGVLGDHWRLVATAFQILPDPFREILVPGMILLYPRPGNPLGEFITGNPGPAHYKPEAAPFNAPSGNP